MRPRRRPVGLTVGGPGVLLRNTSANVVGRAWTTLVSLALTPYILSRVGPDRFGFWALVGVLGGYFALVDCGIVISADKHIAEFAARRDVRAINELLTTSVLFYLVMGGLLVAALIPLTGPLLRFFHVDPANATEAAAVLRLAGVAFATRGVFELLNGVQRGFQRMELLNALHMGLSVPAAVATVVCLERGAGLRGLMGVAIGISVIGAAASWAIGRRVFPALRLGPALLSGGTFRRALRYGMRLQLARVADVISFQADRIVLGHWLPLSFVAYYHLGMMLVVKGREAAQLLVSALLPAVADLWVRGGVSRVRALYARAYQALAVVLIPGFMFLLVKAPLLLRVWLGEVPTPVLWAVQVLAVGYGVYVLGLPAAQVGAGIGRAEIPMRAALVQLILTVSLVAAGVTAFGYRGALVGMAAALVGTHLYLLATFHRAVRVTTLAVVRRGLAGPLQASGLAAVCITALGWAGGIGVGLARPAAAWGLLAQGVVFIGMYILLMRCAGEVPIAQGVGGTRRVIPAGRSLPRLAAAIRGRVPG